MAESKKGRVWFSGDNMFFEDEDGNLTLYEKVWLTDIEYTNLPGQGIVVERHTGLVTRCWPMEMRHEKEV